MRCGKCGTENPCENQFCGKCGERLAVRPEPIAVPGEPGAYYCARHKSVSTRVRCRRCDTPICPKCMVPGAVGNLCRACAHERSPFRWRGFLHSAGRSVGEGAPRAVWYLVVWSLLISIIRNVFGGRDS